MICQYCGEQTNTDSNVCDICYEGIAEENEYKGYFAWQHKDKRKV